ncbi:MAG: hypothetical protein M3530_04705 [Thermoproteota archaeon]|nr:hypothetical protein [Thermoproteota archaeon]
MGNSTLPTVLDKLCMVANINTRKLIGELSDEIKIRSTRLEGVAERIKFLKRRPTC